MKNLSERGMFEDRLKKMFEEAKATPSNDLWTRIDADLANDKANKYERKIFVYQWVAAAAVFIAVSFAAISLFYQQPKPQDNTVATKETVNTNNNDAPSNKIDQKQQNNKAMVNTEGNNSKIDNKIIKSQYDIPIASLPANKTEQENNESPAATGFGNQSYEQIALANNLEKKEKFALHKPESIKLPMYVHIYKRPTVKDLELIVKKEKHEDKFWAGVNFSSGSFDPGFSESGSSFAIANDVATTNRDATSVISGSTSFKNINAESYNLNTTNDEERMSPGISYTAGINTGFRIGKRFTIETGLSYMENTNPSQTSRYIETREESTVPLTMANYGDQAYNLSRVNYSQEEIRLNNSYEFVSVPVKAAYWLLQSDLSLALSAGVSTNIFIQNSVTNQTTDLENIRVKPGDQSPYRNVYFNGVLSTQLTYQLPGANYSIMIEPSYLLALNNMTKEDYYFNSRPKSFMLGVGLRYHFN